MPSNSEKRFIQKNIQNMQKGENYSGYSIGIKNRIKLNRLKSTIKRRSEGLELMQENFHNYFDFQEDIYYTHNRQNGWEGLTSMIYDNRLSKDIKWTDPYGELKEVSGEVFLNRSSLMYTIVENFLIKKTDGGFEYNGKPIKILFFDLDNFASTNIYDKNNRTLGGDYVINLVAKQIKAALRDFKSDYGDIYKNLKVTGARYGGDEFIFLVEGDADEFIMDKIIKYLQDYVESIKAFYKNSKESLYYENVKLKGGEIKVIEVPENEIEKKVFFDYIIKHSVLDKYELKKVVADLKKDNGLDIEDIRPSYRSYPDYVKDDNTKLQFIGSDQECLKKYIRMARYIDSQNNNLDCSQKIISFYESVIIKPNVGFKELYFDAFVNDIIRKKNNVILIFDPKGLKEINNQTSVARGDVFLKKVFWTFKTAVDFAKFAHMAAQQEILPEDYYGTKGSTKMVFGDNIDKYSSEILECMKGISDQGGIEFGLDSNNLIRLPFGYAKVDISNIWNLPKDKWFELITARINQGIKLCENIFFVDLVKKINSGYIDLNVLKDSLDKKINLLDYRVTSAASLSQYIDIYLSGPVSFARFDKRHGVPLRYINRVEEALKMTITEYSIQKLALDESQYEFLKQTNYMRGTEIKDYDIEVVKDSLSRRLDVRKTLSNMNQLKLLTGNNIVETFEYLIRLLNAMKKV